MEWPTEIIHTAGRCPTAERIRQQREEQLQALRIARVMLGGATALAFRRGPDESLRRLSLARGLPTR